MLRAILTIPVRVHEDVGISSDAKEAIAFAYLAKSALEGQMSNIPAATGARPGVLGEICYPLPHVKGGRDMSQSISVEAKIGQLMVFGFNGTRVTSFLRRMITEHNLGGVIHFARNVESVKQLTGLNQELQALSSQSPSGVPLWIAADQEGGTVARLTRGVAVAPSAMALGAAGSEVLTERVCEVAGRELGGAGINMNLAPVVDVNNNPENPVIGVRSFGETPQDVARHGAAAIRGYQKYVAAVAKHFPGHGDTAIDSHHALPVMAHDRQRLDDVELVPFREAIAAGVTGIMTAHIAIPALEKAEGIPVTLSYQVLTKLLKEELAYQGLILTDCMEMKAIQDTFGTVKAAVLTIEAGADLVLISQTQELQRQAYDALVAAVKAGRISEERIDESYARVIRAKERLDLWGRKPGAHHHVIGSSEHVDVMRQAIRQSLTLVQDQNNLPLGDERILLLDFQGSAATVAEDVLGNTGSLGQALRRGGMVHLEEVNLGTAISDREMQAVLAKAKTYEKILVVTSDAHRNQGQGQFVSALSKEHEGVIVIGTRTPYELQVFPRVPTYIAAYGSRPLVWDEVAKFLLGKTKALGQLPVSIPRHES